ncbi:MAG: SDR family oxidoreductase [Pirellulaceae bacterium]|nr:SDR family oxidoreductase [Pirellulaceae bacterium]
MIDLTNQVALVTGGSRGIGRAVALRLAQAGADVIVNYVTSQSAAKEVADQIAALGRRTATIKADVSEPEDIASMLEFVGNSFGKLDILVSNAASGGFRSLMSATPRHFDATMKTNVQALMLLTQAALPLMQQDSQTPSNHTPNNQTSGSQASGSQTSGSSPSSGRPAARRKIIAMSSHGSHRALPAYGLIGASKAALESLARHLAYELGNQGINVNVVLAGLVASDSTRNFPESQRIFDAIAQRRLVSGRELLAEDVANAVLYLASPLSDLVQGQVLTIDGGEALHG